VIDMAASLKKIVIVGATSALAEQCARFWLTQSAADMSLVGRDAGKLDMLAADLKVRNPAARIHTHVVDFQDPAAIDQLVAQMGATGAVDDVLIAHGSLPDQTACQAQLALIQEAIAVNATSPVMFAEAFVRQMVAAGKGTVGIIGSVAGDRGRKSNYVYGAAKGLVTRYAEGLQHRLAGSNVKVVLIEPGPTDTPMTAHLKAAGAKLADASEVARLICNAMDRGQPVAYVPAKWRLIMMVIKHLPRFVFNRMDI